MAWFRTMMLVWLETEKLKLSKLLWCYNECDHDSGLTLLTKTDWILTRTGSWDLSKILSFKPSVQPAPGVLWDASWELSAGFLFSQNCDNWHPAGTLSPLSDPRLGHRTLHAVSSAAPHCRNLILCQTLISNHNHSEPLTNESQTWDVTCRTPRPSLCDHTSHPALISAQLSSQCLSLDSDWECPDRCHSFSAHIGAR